MQMTLSIASRLLIAVSIVVGAQTSLRADVVGAPTLDAAIAHYRSLDYANAIRVAEKVLALGRSGPKALQSLYELLAKALSSIDQPEQAKQYWRRLLALRPGYRLDDSISPKIRKPLVEVLADWAGRPGLTMAHWAPDTAPLGQAVTHIVSVVEDPAQMVRQVRVVYRLPGERRVRVVQQAAGRGRNAVVIPVDALGSRPGRVEYRVHLLDAHGNVVAHKGSRAEPLVLTLTAAPAEVHRATPWYGKWWIWTIAGVVVAGATAAAVLVATAPQDTSTLNVGYEVGLRAGER